MPPLNLVGRLTARSLLVLLGIAVALYERGNGRARARSSSRDGRAGLRDGVAQMM